MTSNRPQTLRPDQARCLGLSGNDRFWLAPCKGGAFQWVQNPRGTGRAPGDGGEVRSTAEAGNAGGGKGPQFNTDATSGEGFATPKTVQKLQKALHAKAKAEAGYRFSALYGQSRRYRG